MMKEVYVLIGVYIFLKTYETVHSDLYSLLYVYNVSIFLKKGNLGVKMTCLCPLSVL